MVEVPGGRDTGVAIERTRFNANLGWHHDGRAFYYAHVPEGIADPLRRYEGIRVYRHVLGRPAAQDEIVFASGAAGALVVPRFVYPSIVVPEDSVHAYAIARDGVRREIAVYMTPVKELAKGLPKWTRIVDFDDGVVAIRAWKEDIYLLTHKGAPRFKVLHMKAGKPDVDKARTFVAQGDAVILDLALAADALYLRTTVGGLERLERLNFASGSSTTPEFVKTAFDVSISQLVAHPRRPGAVLRTQGFVEAPAVIAVEAKTGNLKNTGLQPAPKADFGAIDEVRLSAPGHDGTKILVTLLYARRRCSRPTTRRSWWATRLRPVADADVRPGAPSPGSSAEASSPSRTSEAAASTASEWHRRWHKAARRTRSSISSRAPSSW